jgi:DNA mismatch repair protein MutL
VPIIRKLDSFTVNQIAAGEVVERPASIVKELLENSIDADAAAITAEIEEGGIALIRVTDNGTGMDREDAETSFQRHATSKITAAEDLNSIHTLGFRGEALASISSVSQMEMITRQRGAVSGYRIINHGGRIQNASETGCPEGTTILVRNLFYNTPARLKFLKSARSETAAVSELVGKLILAHPEVSVKYISNGKIVYHSSGNGSLLSAVISVYGKETKDELVELDACLEESSFSVAGYLGRPSLARTSRAHQSFFVNSRYIKSPLLSQCIEEAAKDQTMINHFPWCVLSIQLPSQEIDVNVHPSKTEIRFKKPETIYQSLLGCLREAISGKPYIPAVVMKTGSPKVVQMDAFTPASSVSPVTGSYNGSAVSPVNTGFAPSIPAKTDQLREEPYTAEEADKNGLMSDLSLAGNVQLQKEIPIQISEGAQTKQVYIRNAEPEKNIPDESMNPKEDDNTINAYDFMKMNIIGSAFSTFILAESEKELYIIDQHAAHERLIYERLKESVKRQEVLSQQLLPPYVLEVTHDEYLAISDSLQNFLSIGFDMEPFGGKSFLIRGVPILIKEANIRELFHDLMDRPEYKTGNARLLLQQEDIILMSCKKAVKANDKLSAAEIRSLLRDMNQNRIPFTCPHGRPILISMSRYELEKKFKRIQ